MSPPPATYATRLRECERREQMTIWVAAGLGTLFAVVGVDALKKAPEIFGTLLLTIAIMGGLCLAFARITFEWLATGIRRRIEDGLIQKNDPLSASDVPWPKEAERFWLGSLLAILFGWTLFLIGIWWSPVQTLLKPKTATTHAVRHQTTRFKTVSLDIEGIPGNSQLTFTTETDAVPCRIVISSAP